jgi:hypothetical protein
VHLSLSNLGTLFLICHPLLFLGHFIELTILLFNTIALYMMICREEKLYTLDVLLDLCFLTINTESDAIDPAAGFGLWIYYYSSNNN